MAKPVGDILLTPAIPLIALSWAASCTGLGGGGGLFIIQLRHLLYHEVNVVRRAHVMKNRFQGETPIESLATSS